MEKAPKKYPSLKEVPLATLLSTMLTNPPVPYDFCVGVPISHLLTVGSTPVQHSVLNVKALVGAFNQEKALIGAFSVIVKTGCGTDGSICGTTNTLLVSRTSSPLPSFLPS